MRYQSEKLVVHLARDEKFIDMAMRSFEYYGCKNELYVYGYHKCKYIHSEINGRIKPLDSIFGHLAMQLKHADLVVLHSLNEQWVNIVLKLPKEIPILWLGWGGDYYRYVYPSSNDLLLEQTEKLISLNKNKISIKRIIKSLLIKVFIQNSFLQAISRIDFFAPVLVNEYGKIESNLKLNPFPKQVVWNYGNLEENLVKGYENKRVTGKNILVGNSSTPTNNHIDTITLLKRINLKSRVIICPLSYGDKAYREAITSNGCKSFGSYFEPLIDFMPIESYLNKIKSCGFVLMNHVRQEALGNIVIMLYLGAKVFLREENPIYPFLKGEGVKIYSIQDLESDFSLLEERLNFREMDRNRAIMQDHFSKSTSDIKTTNMLEEIFNYKRPLGRE